VTLLTHRYDRPVRPLPFDVWVRTGVAEGRGIRLQMLHTMLAAIGPMFPSELREKLARAGKPVTIDTVQRDLGLLLKLGYVQKSGHRHYREGWRYALLQDSL